MGGVSSTQFLFYFLLGKTPKHNCFVLHVVSMALVVNLICLAHRCLVCASICNIMSITNGHVLQFA